LTLVRFNKPGRANEGNGGRPATEPAVRKRIGAAKNVAVMALSAGIVATLALPAYAFTPDASNAGTEAGAALARLTAQEAQNVIVAADARAPEAQRDAFSATTMAELKAERERKRAAKRAKELAAQQALEAQRERQLTAEREQQRAALAPSSQPAPAPQTAASPGSKPAARKPAAAPAPSAAGGSIVSVARQYLGVPYVYGGASPSGFDCSGLTMYVYAKFGISLPHSAARQAANGTRVSSPQPGDLVVIDGASHIGIYTGNGNMIDAPMPGRVVNERKIYSSNHYFVRY
jgi:cell wall-associated NlpC family hydrolase